MSFTVLIYLDRVPGSPATEVLREFSALKSLRESRSALWVNWFIFIFRLDSNKYRSSNNYFWVRVLWIVLVGEIILISDIYASKIFCYMSLDKFSYRRF